MYKSLFILLASTTLALISCKKEKDSTEPTTPTTTGTGMNATETKLLGTWFIKKERDSMFTTSFVYQRDTTFTGYDPSNYIKFSESTVGTDYWKCEDAVGLITNQVTPPDILANTASVGSFWHYEESAGFLIVSTYQYRIVSLTGTELVLHSKVLGRNKYHHFSK
jgi:hypothetical protein